MEKFNIVSNDHGHARKNAKRLAFAGFLHPRWKFGARKYFTGHHTPYTIHGFGDSFLVCKYTTVTEEYAKSSSSMQLLPIQATQTNITVQTNKNKLLQTAFARI